MKNFYTTLLFLLMLFTAAGQKSAVNGTVTGPDKQPLELVNIKVAGTQLGTSTNAAGKFQLEVTAGDSLQFVFTSVGFEPASVWLSLKPGERRTVDVTLFPFTEKLSDVVIEDRRSKTRNVTLIDPKLTNKLPGATGGVEGLIKTLPGVSSTNELSSQYSVRGGSFDENLVYVNDIEIYRPFLTRTGQQEGLSFVNSDMVSSVSFSAGGFEARYGDKMSSVLDIRYRKPQEFGGSVFVSLLGASLHLEGVGLRNKLGFQLGARRKSNAFLLRRTDLKGVFDPSFSDIQTFVTYTFNPKLEVNFLGNYSFNRFHLQPLSSQTPFGPLGMEMLFNMAFAGNEINRFSNGLGAVTLDYKPGSKTNLKLIFSSFNTQEAEAFDVDAVYYLSETDTELGSENYGKPRNVLGTGGYLRHARNLLDVSVSAAEHRGLAVLGNSTLQWSVKAQKEIIDDRIYEWIARDSAGFTLPYSSPVQGEPGNRKPLLVDELVTRDHNLNTNRFSAFVQNTNSFHALKGELILNYGIRGSYWDLNKQFLFSPRVSMSYFPNWQDNLQLRLAGGIYFQPPFYREMRDYAGDLNTALQAQESYQALAGADYTFRAWGRPFKFTTEAYYKHLKNLVPYDIDNVRLRYHANNNATGFATGIDLRLYGEFVEGIDSWASFSYMKTMEDLKGDFYTIYRDVEGNEISRWNSDFLKLVADTVTLENGMIARPTDQRFNLSIFFQDYIPNHPSFKMQLGLHLGGGLPYSAPKSVRNRNYFRMPLYRRVDIGFSKEIIGVGFSTKNRYLNRIESSWLSLEVLNLLGVKNTVSYSWVQDASGIHFAIPNYLTTRQINLKLNISF